MITACLPKGNREFAPFYSIFLLRHLVCFWICFGSTCAEMMHILSF